MKKLTVYLLSIVCVVFYSCSSKPDDNKASVSNKFGDSIIHEIRPYKGDYDFKVHREDSVVIIGAETYTLILKAEIDTLQECSYTEVYSKEGKNYKDIYFGYEAIYTVELHDSKDNEIFKTYINKENFKGLFDGMILTVSDASLPQYLGYQRKFNSFLFTVYFYKPESDVGDQCFFMIDRNGEVKHLFWTNYLGGPNCNGDVNVSEDGLTILTCTKIIRYDGKAIDISAKKLMQVSTHIINDSCMLVIQEHNDTTNRNNAILMNAEGNVLQKFTYKGYYSELEYYTPIYFDSLTHHVYLLDETAENVRIIDQYQPLKSSTVSFDILQKSGAAKMSRERTFDISGQTKKYTFLIDTITGKQRMLRGFENN